MAYNASSVPSSTGVSCPPSASAASIMQRLYDFHLGSGDNGNVWVINNCKDINRTQNYFYDSLNRITQAYTTGNSPLSTSWGETFTIDAWGNLTNKGAVANKTNTEGLAAAPASIKNQLNGFCNDAPGNLVLNAACPTGTFTPIYSYDIENRLTSAAAGYSYVYDGDGQRVKKCSNAGCTTGTLYWRGATGDPLAEFTVAGAATNTYIFFNGRRIARHDNASGNDDLYFSDHLGSADVIANTLGSVSEESEYFPYGGEIVVVGSTVNHYKFTGKERDAETCTTACLDYFGARHYTSSVGRFMTPDPIFVTKHRLLDPQQWNLYAYVRNNPVNLTDPTGKDLWLTGCGKDSPTCHKGYVGTWDKDHKNFTPTTIQSDKNGNFKDHNVTMDTSGIHVDGKYQGVFASGTAATVVNGTGNLSGFQAMLNRNCLGHCEAGGTISALPGHSFGDLFKTLRGPNEKLDVFSGHEGDQYRGGNYYGPDIHISYLQNRDAQSMHFDWAFPFGSAGGFAQHTGDFIGEGIDRKVLRETSDPAYDEVGP
jgi:RHS repeat-associated protein